MLSLMAYSFKNLNMLRVKTTIGLSRLHGVGLFADQFIKKGSITWQYDPGLDPDFSFEEVENLEKSYRNVFEKYGYRDFKLGKFIVCIDDQRFINHSSKNFNVLSTPDRDVAVKDINLGEELLCNYNDYEQDWFKRRNLAEREFLDLDILSK